MGTAHRRHGPEPTAAVAYIGRNGKYISSRAKSPLHTLQGGGARTCVRFKRAMATPVNASLNFIIRNRAGRQCMPRTSCELDTTLHLQPSPYLKLHLLNNHDMHNNMLINLIHNKKCVFTFTYKYKTSFRCNFRFFRLASENSEQRKINMLKPELTSGKEEKILKIKKIFV